MFCYEVIPSYIFPLLNGVNVICLATQRVSPKAQDVITNLFGGTDGNEGLGLLSLSFDWQYITSRSVIHESARLAHRLTVMATVAI